MSEEPKTETRSRYPVGVRLDKALRIQRETDALALRAAGHQYEEIARALGFSTRSAAQKAVIRALRRREVLQVDELRKLESARLDELQSGIYREATRGNLRAIDRIVKISERRARLLGLDAPLVTLEGAFDVNADNARSVLAERLSAIAKRRGADGAPRESQ